MMFVRTILLELVVLCFTNLAFAAPDHPLITPKPRAPTAAQLAYRQDDTGPNPYGYIGGDINSPLACGAGFQFTTDGELGLCCNQVDCTSIIATCVDKNGGLDICSGAYSDMCALSSISVLHCKSPAPSCFRYMRITDAQDLNPAYVHRCGTASDDVTVFVTPTNEAAVQTEDPSPTAPKTSITQQNVAATKTQGAASGPTSGADPGSPGTSKGTESSGIFKGNAWKYAVIGVGVVIVILVLLVVILCHWRRSRKVKPALPAGGGVAHSPAGIPYLDTVAGSVAGDMAPEKRAFVGRWTQSQAGGHPDAISETDTLVSRGSRRI
ncbi:hypothetical protein ONS95_011856 [Cadophora gregata]|uniref:uncharacterized protein n=1 Tax=Cadophora gregata TaxID=51156 RepID=UPI0026DCA62C|nr:uncharacterized protein ONS95_011856 [Cadophora gregata]KAK0117516.1 hypothetical protein ONS95_011856 [Cadophora gregata]KAK0122570.1 hypothetical protein ONS96_009612 [Cadophora gregata f. sp. sojae]